LDIIRPLPPRLPPRVAVFDFDGTLSLIRGGWTDVMVRMMVDLLVTLPRADDAYAVKQRVTDFVLELNGQPTIFQMQRFAEEVYRAGGRPEPPEAYHREYLRRLGERIAERKAALRDGSATPDDLMVPGARRLLETLIERGVELTLASGTEVEYVREEAAVLRIDHFFAGGLHGPGDDPRAFSKLAVMQEALARNKTAGAALLGFGDGVVETENAHFLGGVAIGVASDEIHRSGEVVEWKRTRLIDAGAHVIVPDYMDHQRLIDWLWDVQ
jgi:phosphoglycolate phosphatase-like HAD superfamily hydrolase